MENHETKILFWNTNAKSLATQITSIVALHDIDIVLLAESAYINTVDDLLQELNLPETHAGQHFQQISDNDTRVQIFSKIPAVAWSNQRHRDRYDIWRVRVDTDLFLAVVHFPEIMYEQGDGQRKSAIDLRLDIDEIEQRYVGRAVGTRSLGLPLMVIGDLNASPFDPGIAGVYGLNGTQRRIIAREGARMMNGIWYPFMYNPMWQFLGAPETKAPGTYYGRMSGRPVSYDWYVLDQVLLKPALLSRISDQDVRIIEHAGSESLVGNDRRPKVAISDHLPIVVTIRA